MQVPFLVYVAGISVTFPVLAGFRDLRSQTADFRLLFGLFGFNTLITIIQFMLAAKAINNLWTSHVYNLVEMTTFAWIFSRWAPSIALRRIFLSSGVLYAILWFLLKITIEGFDAYRGYSSPISRLLLMAGVIMILVSLAQEIDRPLVRNPRFWIAAGLLVSCSGSLTFLALQVVVASLPTDAMFRAFTIHWLVQIVSNTLLAIAFLCKPRSATSGGQLELVR